MIKVFIFGISGKMGRAICDSCKSFSDMEVTGGFDIVSNTCFPTFDSVEKINVPFDVIIDYSRPETLDSVLEASRKFSCPVVIATTGYEQKQLDKITNHSSDFPVFLSGNMSIGVNVLIQLVRRATELLWDSFDTEIIEKHHNQKVDSPSGTAKMIAAAINTAANEKANYIYGREGNNTLRKKNELAIHAVRGGTIVGEHEVLFCGNDEIVSLKHSALSRKIFADGSLKAAKFIMTKSNGMFTMTDLLG